MITTVPGAATSEKCLSDGKFDDFGTMMCSYSSPSLCVLLTKTTVLMGATMRLLEPSRVGIGAVKLLASRMRSGE